MPRRKHTNTDLKPKLPNERQTKIGPKVVRRGRIKKFLRVPQTKSTDGQSERDTPHGHKTGFYENQIICSTH